MTKPLPTVAGDLELLARAAEEDQHCNHYWTREEAQRLVRSFRSPDPATLWDDLELVQWARPDPRAYYAASRLKKVISQHTSREVAAIFNAA